MITDKDPMTPGQFDEAVRMLHSTDPQTYEDGYWWLHSALNQYAGQIAALLRSEVDPRMRATFVELVGDADLPEYIPLLVQELSNETREVRAWAYTGLVQSDHELARAQAEEYRETHPEEDFYH